MKESAFNKSINHLLSLRYAHLLRAEMLTNLRELSYASKIRVSMRLSTSQRHRCHFHWLANHKDTIWKRSEWSSSIGVHQKLMQKSILGKTFWDHNARTLLDGLYLQWKRIDTRSSRRRSEIPRGSTHFISLRPS